MKIIVTGGAGFIGSALCRHLVGECGETVLNIDKLTYAANLELLAPIQSRPQYYFLKADICDAGTLSAAIEEFAPDAVVHLAAESHVDRSITGASPFIQTNVVGTYTLLEVLREYWRSLPDARRAAFRLLHVSTDEVYGSLGADGLFSEDTAYDPSSPYSASKAASDHLVMAWHRPSSLVGAAPQDGLLRRAPWRPDRARRRGATAERIGQVNILVDRRARPHGAFAGRSRADAPHPSTVEPKRSIAGVRFGIKVSR